MKAIAQNEYSSPGMKHHRVVVTRHGGPEVLQMVEEDLPEPRAGEVRVKVLAAGVSAFSIHSYFILTGHPEFTLPVSLAVLFLTLIVSLAQGFLAFKELLAKPKAA